MPDPPRSPVRKTGERGDNSGTTDLAFTVSLSAAAKSPVTVTYKTTNGTATAGSDYTAQSGTLTFAAGETSKIVHVSVLGDTAVEANETLALALSSPNGATIARGTATGTITNDDVTPPALSIGDAAFAEGSAATPGHGIFTVTMSQASTSPVIVSFATANGVHDGRERLCREDRHLSPSRAYETSKTISVAAIGDGVVEANEGFTVVLSTPTGATISMGGTAAGTITNDDVAPPPTISISDCDLRRRQCRGAGTRHLHGDAVEGVDVARDGKLRHGERHRERRQRLCRESRDFDLRRRRDDKDDLGRCDW